jgi:hypothetical protein
MVDTFFYNDIQPYLLLFSIVFDDSSFPKKKFGFLNLCLKE